MGAVAVSPTRTIAQSAIAASITGTTNETTLATITIPAGSMGPNGSIVVETLWSVTNSANNKTTRVKFGATTFQSRVLTTSAADQAIAMISNRNSQVSQVGAPSALTGYGGSTGAVVTATENTAQDVTLLITAQLASAGETITLERYVARLYPKS